MQVNFNLQESTTKDVSVRNQGVSRNIVNAFKQIFFALKTVNVRTARTLKEVKKEDLYFMMTIMPWPTFNMQLMQPLMGPLDPQVMGTLQYPEREKPTDSLQA